MHLISRSASVFNVYLRALVKNNKFVRNICVLGIETSCDDTGLAVVNVQGEVLSNVLNSQQKYHARYGGIIPPRARDLHRIKIADIFERCIAEANIKPSQLDAIAVTTRPGLPLSLVVGLRFAKHLARKYHKPIVPVHHMEAHALQARMEHHIPYPFLCLLISGGHCQLVFVRGPDNFALLGESMDDAPGEAFDKIARRLRLYIIPKYRNLNGGQAMEEAAKEAHNPKAFEFPLLLAHQRNCNFSFSGIKNSAYRAIRLVECQEGTPPDGVISNYPDFCASLLHAITRHLMHRTQRALEFCIANDFFGTVSPSLVVSGGVANNDSIFANITHLAKHYNCQTYRPTKKYCSDNGVMIAWNGIEQLLTKGEACMRWNYDELAAQGKATLGTSLLDDVEEASIKCKWVQATKS